MPVLTGQPIAASCATYYINQLGVMGPNLSASSVNINASCGVTLTGFARNLVNSSAMSAASAVVYSNAILNILASTATIFNLNGSSGILYRDIILAASSTIDSLMKQSQAGFQVSS